MLLVNGWYRLWGQVKKKTGQRPEKLPRIKPGAFYQFVSLHSSSFLSPFWFFVCIVFHSATTAHMWPQFSDSGIILPEAVWLCWFSVCRNYILHSYWDSQVKEAYWFLLSELKTSNWVSCSIHSTIHEATWAWMTHKSKLPNTVYGLDLREDIFERAG